MDDMEALRQSLDINKFVLFGGSWGSTLALAYSIAYPEHVSGLILRGIFLGTRPEVDWFLNDMGRFFPEAHDRFVGHLDPSERIDLLTSYFNRLVDSNPAVHQKAAEAWASYETSCSTLRAGDRHMGGTGALTMARIEAYYFINDCFMPKNHIMDNIGRVSHLPAIIVQGRHDVICPPVTARKLAAKWGENARLQIIEAAGHSTFESGIAHASDGGTGGNLAVFIRKYCRYFIKRPKVAFSVTRLLSKTSVLVLDIITYELRIIC